MFVQLSGGGGGGEFSKLDLKNAYNQIMLDDNSREFVIINTHKGLFRPTRLPYGVAPASAIFQSKMEQLLQGIHIVVCRVDDILVSGQDDTNHLAHLNEVLTRLRAANLCLRLDKCKFLQPSAEYLEYLNQCTRLTHHRQEGCSNCSSTNPPKCSRTAFVFRNA